jgi:hypothetical protein
MLQSMQQQIYRQITHERERESKCWSPELDKSISSGAQYAMIDPACRVQLDEEMSKKMPVWLREMVLALYNWTLRSGWWMALVRLCTCRKECNKYDLTTDQCFWLAAHHNDWFRWFAIRNYLLSQFQFYRWGCQKK